MSNTDAAGVSPIATEPQTVDVGKEVPEAVEPDRLERYRQFLEAAYVEGEALHASGAYASLQATLGKDAFDAATELGKIRHAARGIALTLAAYKAIVPLQDIRFHKAEHPGGFSARTIDAAGTIPILQAHSLYYNVESHWLSQTFSFSPPYLPDQKLNTVPKKAGPLMIQLVNVIQNSPKPQEAAKAVVLVIISSLIDERNRGKVLLEKPQNLSIDQTVELLRKHFSFGYTKNAPRLPQIAIYAIYECLMPSMERYEGLTLQPLEKMKAANRKSGSVGDIDINKGALAFEAVEIKFDIPVSRQHVAEAIAKIKTASVKRYFILSTAGYDASETATISKLQRDFLRSNGCEIIVNGVLETIKYYLRLIDSPASFINYYASRVETDTDLGYEHRLAWNAICAERTHPVPEGTSPVEAHGGFYGQTSHT